MNNYNKSINKIKTDDDLKQKIIENMRIEKEKMLKEEKLKLNGPTIIRKIISGIIGLALCGGIAYAGVVEYKKREHIFGGAYEVPSIKKDSEDVDEINKKIKEFYKNATGKSNFEDIDYEYFINNNILSVVITDVYGPSDCNEFMIYNIDINTGKEISNTELIKTRGICEEKYLEKLKEIYEEEWINYVGMFEPNPMDSRREEYEKTISIENCNIESKIFLDNEGKINVVVPIYCFYIYEPIDYRLSSTKI